MEVNNNSQFTNHVVISLKDYEAMKDETERLRSEKADINRKYENIKRLIDDLLLPSEIIADGRVKHKDWEVDRNPMTREIKYRVTVTVLEEDARRYGYETRNFIPR